MLSSRDCVWQGAGVIHRHRQNHGCRRRLENDAHDPIKRRVSTDIIIVECVAGFTVGIEIEERA